MTFGCEMFSLLESYRAVKWVLLHDDRKCMSLDPKKKCKVRQVFIARFCSKNDSSVFYEVTPFYCYMYVLNLLFHKQDNRNALPGQLDLYIDWVVFYSGVQKRLFIQLNTSSSKRGV